MKWKTLLAVAKPPKIDRTRQSHRPNHTVAVCTACYGTGHELIHAFHMYIYGRTYYRPSSENVAYTWQLARYTYKGYNDVGLNKANGYTKVMLKDYPKNYNSYFLPFNK